MSAPVLWEDTIHPGATWSHVVKRGTALRLTDFEGGANAGAIFYNFECPTERYNMPDTLKAQHIARLTAGFCLYSDMGRILYSITEDLCGWHDPLCGFLGEAEMREKHGEATYQECRNDYHKSARDGFVGELEKWGLSPRDLNANINFFSRVDTREDGQFSFAEGNSKAGDSVMLRAEMNVLTIVNTCPHPLDPNSRYSPKPVGVQILKVAEAAADDECRLSRPENGRGFELTRRYFL